jgi:hypothetical protein
MLLMCCRIQELGVSCCLRMTDRGLLEGIGSLLELTSLRLSGGDNLTAQAWSTFLHQSSMTSMVVLNLTDCRYLVDEGLKGIAERCNKLTFYMFHCSGLSWTWSASVCVWLWGKFIIVCIYRCIYLEKLTVCGCCNVTDAGISIVISHCNQLRVLDLTGLAYITGTCALCEDSEPTLSFITLWCMIFLQQVHH